MTEAARPVGSPLIWALPAALLLALGVRLCFLAFAPVAAGDAINYYWVAVALATGDSSAGDFFWHGLFCYWEALLILLGAQHYTAMVLASLIPGVLLLLPIYAVTVRLLGALPAVIAAFAAALHPRLAEYSVNGYAETFYLCCALTGIWGVIAFAQGARSWAGVAAGLGLGGYVLVRNEGVLLAGALFLWMAWIAWREQRIAPPLVTVVCGLSFLAVYAGANVAIIGNSGLFQKGSNLSKQYSEQLDPHEAAREAYGQNTGGQAPSFAETVWTLAARFPRNVAYSLRRLPLVLLSPLPLLAPLAWLCWERRHPRRGLPPSTPLWLGLLFPLAFYPLIQVEPRHFFLTLVCSLALGAGGLVHGCGAFAPRVPRLLPAAAAALLIGLLLPLFPLARAKEKQLGFHRDAGGWIAAHIPAGDGIIGDGYGYVTASTFWAQRRGFPRRWTEDPAGIAEEARVLGRPIVLLYERFLKESNPELLPVLDTGIPGMARLHEFAAAGMGRMQIYRLTP